MDAQISNSPNCPFCPFFDQDSNFVTQHVQYCHPENDSHAESEAHNFSRTTHRTSLEDQVSASTDDDLFCENSSSRLEEMTGPGEYGPFEQVISSQHRLQIERAGYVDQSHATKNIASQVDDQNALPLLVSSRKTPKGNIKRLGRGELGPYANEKKMPSWLLRLLDTGNATTKINKITPDGRISRHVIVENQTSNVVPTLAQLCGQDKSVQRAFLCSTHVHQISKIPREGGFCGYRNIQMLVSYLQESRSPGSERFPKTLPTILQLQDMIEHAWDSGFNSTGRTETGGIKGTRKYIGTSEAQALFLSLGIQCEANSIGKIDGMPAHSSLLSHIAAYFRSASPLNTSDKVVLTNLPPIYFQHHGHSMTIVGFEIRDKGSANILVFDPTFKTPSLIKNALATKLKNSEPARILKGYRRGVKYLQQYQIFELLKLSPPGNPPDN